MKYLVFFKQIVDIDSYFTDILFPEALFVPKNHDNGWVVHPPFQGNQKTVIPNRRCRFWNRLGRVPKFVGMNNNILEKSKEKKRPYLLIKIESNWINTRNSLTALQFFFFERTILWAYRKELARESCIVSRIFCDETDHTLLTWTHNDISS